MEMLDKVAAGDCLRVMPFIPNGSVDMVLCDLPYGTTRNAWVAPDGTQRGRKRGGRNFSAAEMREMGFVRLPPAPKIKFVHRAR